jgi:hypothetical protein
MSLFLSNPNQDRLVNLKNVSFVFLDSLYHSDGIKYRVVFNLNYSIKLDNKELISDYIYWSFETQEEAINELERIKNSGYFIIGPEDSLKLINLDSVSSVKFDDKNIRVIWNLNNSISRMITDKWNKHQKKEIITADFVYWDFKSQDIYLDFKSRF